MMDTPFVHDAINSKLLNKLKRKMKNILELKQNDRRKKNI